jgi:hypothetical protein
MVERFCDDIDRCCWSGYWRSSFESTFSSFCHFYRCELGFICGRLWKSSSLVVSIGTIKWNHSRRKWITKSNSFTALSNWNCTGYSELFIYRRFEQSSCCWVWTKWFSMFSWLSPKWFTTRSIVFSI